MRSRVRTSPDASSSASTAPSSRSGGTGLNSRGLRLRGPGRRRAASSSATSASPGSTVRGRGSGRPRRAPRRRLVRRAESAWRARVPARPPPGVIRRRPHSEVAGRCARYAAGLPCRFRPGVPDGPILQDPQEVRAPLPPGPRRRPPADLLGRRGDPVPGQRGEAAIDYGGEYLVTPRRRESLDSNDVRGLAADASTATATTGPYARRCATRPSCARPRATSGCAATWTHALGTEAAARGRVRGRRGMAAEGRRPAGGRERHAGHAVQRRDVRPLHPRVLPTSRQGLRADRPRDGHEGRFRASAHRDASASRSPTSRRTRRGRTWSSGSTSSTWRSRAPTSTSRPSSRRAPGIASARRSASSTTSRGLRATSPTSPRAWTGWRESHDGAAPADARRAHRRPPQGRVGQRLPLHADGGRLRPPQRRPGRGLRQLRRRHLGDRGPDQDARRPPRGRRGPPPLARGHRGVARDARRACARRPPRAPSRR